jgi:hypothetical protein
MAAGMTRQQQQLAGMAARGAGVGAGGGAGGSFQATRGVGWVQMGGMAGAGAMVGVGGMVGVGAGGRRRQGWRRVVVGGKVLGLGCTRTHS